MYWGPGGTRSSLLMWREKHPLMRYFMCYTLPGSAPSGVECMKYRSLISGRDGAGVTKQCVLGCNLPGKVGQVTMTKGLNPVGGLWCKPCIFRNPNAGKSRLKASNCFS